jgi:DNA invertase Pin-like site-specific DNA recombinase
MAEQKLALPRARPKTEIVSESGSAKRAAVYTRVSGGDQHPETRLYDLRALAKQRRYEIVHEYTDTISDAKSKRPGLDQLLADARRHRFDVVLVAAFDRVARNVRHFLEVLDELNHLEIEFVSLREISTLADHWVERWW